MKNLFTPRRAGPDNTGQGLTFDAGAIEDLVIRCHYAVSDLPANPEQLFFLWCHATCCAAANWPLITSPHCLCTPVWLFLDWRTCWILTAD